MKIAKMLKPAVVSMLLLIYVYIVIKVILFKFGHVDPGFMYSQLMRNIDRPDSIMRQLQYTANLVPFKEISNELSHLSSFEIVNLGGNIAIFMPLGILLPLLFGKRKMLGSVLLIGLAFSLSLETAQLLLTMGIFDVDDIILNTSGALLGFVFYKMFSFGSSTVLVAEPKEQVKSQVESQVVH